MNTLLPQISKFKYKIGDEFVSQLESKVVITGYNHKLSCYRGTFVFAGCTLNKQTYHSDLITESQLNTMKASQSGKATSKANKPDRKRNWYLVHFYDTNKVGVHMETRSFYLDGISSLAKRLNKIKEVTPNQYITLVTVVDSCDNYISYVRFLKQEIQAQKFLTGLRERMLAHGKYVDGYELAIGF